MYQVDEKDKVIELPNIPQSSVGAPLPVVLSDEHKILLAYLLQNTPASWDGSTVRVLDFETDDEVSAVVEFKGYATFMLGSPNDEAFSGHPLAVRGLHPYAAFEIENSSWIRKLERMNSVHEYHKPEKFEKYKHFVFAFHDSTFECVAESFDVSIHEGSLESVLPVMQGRLFKRFS